MFSDGDGFFDEMPEIFGDSRGETLGFQDSENLVTGDESDLGDPMGITKRDANLGGREARPLRASLPK
jgi:hypothetical protein